MSDTRSPVFVGDTVPLNWFRDWCGEVSKTAKCDIELSQGSDGKLYLFATCNNDRADVRWAAKKLMWKYNELYMKCLRDHLGMVAEPISGYFTNAQGERIK